MFAAFVAVCERRDASRAVASARFAIVIEMIAAMSEMIAAADAAIVTPLPFEFCACPFA